MPAQQYVIPGLWIQMIDIRTQVFDNDFQDQCSEDFNVYPLMSGEENKATNLSLFAAKLFFKAFTFTLSFFSLNCKKY